MGFFAIQPPFANWLKSWQAFAVRSRFEKSKPAMMEFCGLSLATSATDSTEAVECALPFRCGTNATATNAINSANRKAWRLSGFIAETSRSKGWNKVFRGNNKILRLAEKKRKTHRTACAAMAVTGRYSDEAFQHWELLTGSKDEVKGILPSYQPLSGCIHGRSLKLVIRMTSLLTVPRAIASCFPSRD